MSANKVIVHLTFAVTILSLIFATYVEMSEGHSFITTPLRYYLILMALYSLGFVYEFTKLGRSLALGKSFLADNLIASGVLAVAISSSLSSRVYKDVQQSLVMDIAVVLMTILVSISFLRYILQVKNCIQESEVIEE